EASEIENLQAGSNLTQSLRELVARHVGHHHIGDENVEPAKLRRAFQRFRTIGRRRRLISRIAEHAVDKLPHWLLIVHHEDSDRSRRRVFRAYRHVRTRDGEPVVDFATSSILPWTRKTRHVKVRSLAHSVREDAEA